MALLILEQTESPPQHTLMVGDIIYDITTGQGGGCSTYGNRTHEQLESLRRTI